MTTPPDNFDYLIDQFESQWRSGSLPAITEYLSQVSEQHKPSLAKLLLQIDIEYRMKRGEKVSVADYERLGEEILPLVQDAIVSQLAQHVEDSDATKTHEPDNRERRSQVIGNYKLLQKLGEGGMGTVWMAEQEKPVRRRVALKLIKAGHDSKEVVARFEAERQALAMMDHHNIAKVLDGGTTESGQPYFVMELVQGIPFNKYCDQNKLSINERLELFVPICNAVQHAHQKGILHRDLKPSNILVSLYDGKPVPKVIDFGLAKALQHQSRLTDKTLFTEFGQVVGTLQYMSPEQAEMNQLDVDTRTDVYSLGVILYELLTGSTPIDADTVKNQAIFKVLESIREKEPPRPSARLSSSTNEAVSGISQQRQIDPGKLKNILRGELDWIVMKALEKDRTRRYETASGFAEDVVRFLTGDIVVARPPTYGYRIRKYMRRNRGVVFSALAILMILAAGLTTTSWFAIQADKARRTADDKTLVANQEREKAESERDRANESETKAANSLNETQRTLSRSNYHLANSYWEAGRASDAKHYLSKIPPEDRNIEWLWSRRNSEGSYATMYGHQSFDVQFVSPRVAVSIGKDDAEDYSVQFWNTTSASEEKRIQLDIENNGDLRSFDIASNGKRVIIGFRRKCECWSIDNNSKVYEIPLACDECIYSPNMKYIAIRGYKQETNEFILYVVDAESGDRILELAPLSYGVNVSALAFSPKSDYIACIYENGGGISVYDLTKRKLHSKFAFQSFSGFNAIAWSPDGSYLGVSRANQISLLSSTTGEPKLHFIGKSNRISRIAFSPNSQLFATAGRDGSIQLWSIPKQTLYQTLVGHDRGITGIDFHASGEWLVSSSLDRSIKLWDLRGTQQAIELPHDSNTEEVHFHQTRPLVITTDWNGISRLWNSETGKLMRSFLTKSTAVSAFSHDGKKFAVGADYQAIDVYDCETLERVITCPGPLGILTNLEFVPNTSLLVSVDTENTVKVWNRENGLLVASNTIVKNESKGFSPGAPAVGATLDGNRIAVAGTFNAYVMNLPDLSFLFQVGLTSAYENSAINKVVFLHEANVLAVGGWNHQIELWDTTSLQRKSVFKHPERVTDFTCLESKHRMFSTCFDSSITLWDMSNGEELRKIYGAHGDGNRINDVDISSDHSILATAGGFSAQLHPLRPIERVHDLEVSEDTTKAWVAPEANRAYATSEIEGVTKKYAWELSSGVPVSTSAWPDVEKLASKSADGRWEVFAGNPVIVIDHNISKDPREIAYRKAKGRHDERWHKNEANLARQNKSAYGELFHRAWQLIIEPDDFFAFEMLRECHEEFLASLKEEDSQAIVAKPPIVEQAMAIRQGTNIESPEAVSFIRKKERESKWDVSVRYWKVNLLNAEKEKKSDLDRTIAIVCLANALKQIGNNQEFEEICKKYSISSEKPVELETGYLDDEKYTQVFDRLRVLGFVLCSGLVDVTEDTFRINVKFQQSASCGVHSWYTMKRLTEEDFKRVNKERNQQNQSLVQDIKYVLGGVEYHFAIWQESVESHAKLVSAQSRNAILWDKIKIAKSVPSNDELNSMLVDCQDFPRGEFYNTLGVAQYRKGLFEAAIQSLDKSMAQSDLANPHPSDLAFLAMSHLGLNHEVEARDYYSKFKKAMSLNAFKNVEECLSFAGEIEEAFQALNREGTK